MTTTQPFTNAWSEAELHTVLFVDGKIGRYPVCFYRGACSAGDPTTYVVRDGSIVWVRPGESVAWIEARPTTPATDGHT